MKIKKRSIEIKVPGTNVSIKISKILRNIDTGEIFFNISCQYRGKTIENTIPRNKITRNGLQELSSFGFPFQNTKANEVLVDNIFEKENEILIENISEGIGWLKYEGKNYFMHYHSISKSGKLDIKYCGELPIEPFGEKEKSYDILNQYIYPSNPLQSMVAFSLSSAISGMLDDDSTFIMHNYGNSTQGKTTSLKVAAWVWGSPKITPNGCIRSWNTTDNALIQKLCGNFGVTICLDEIGTSSSDSKHNLIYLLTRGNDKERLNYGHEAPVFNSFKINIVSSGEIPMRASEELADGTVVRLIEFENVPWTNDKKTADDLLSAMEKSCGHIGYDFASALVKCSKEKIQNSVERHTKIVMKKIEKALTNEPSPKIKNLLGRISSKIAIVLVTAMIANKKLGMTFDINAIRDFFINDSTLLNIEQDEDLMFLNAFLETYTKQKDKFPSTLIGKDGKKATTYDGKTIMKNNKILKIVVFKDAFKNLMRAYKPEVIKKEIQSLRDKKIIICEKGKLYCRRTVFGKKLPCIVIDMVKAAEEGVDYEA